MTVMKLLSRDVLMQIDREGMYFTDEADFDNLVAIARWAAKAQRLLLLARRAQDGNLTRESVLLPASEVAALLAELTPPTPEVCR